MLWHPCFLSLYYQIHHCRWCSQPGVKQWWWGYIVILYQCHQCGVIQGLDFLLGFVFPTWVVAAEMRISLKGDKRRDKLGSSWRLLMFGSTSFVKRDQSTLFCCHLAALGTTGWSWTSWLISVRIGRSSELPIGSASLIKLITVSLIKLL